MNIIAFWELMAKIASFMAKLGAGTASALNNYQPRLPQHLSPEK